MEANNFIHSYILADLLDVTAHNLTAGLFRINSILVLTSNKIRRDLFYMGLYLSERGILDLNCSGWMDGWMDDL